MYSVRIKEIYNLLERIEISDGHDVMGDQNLAFQKLIDCFKKTRENYRKCFFIGNGGSAAIAMHMTVDFMKNGNVRTVSLFDPCSLTCMGNDYGYPHVFSKPLTMLAEEDDLLVAISSSGNSENIIKAIEAARSKRANVITFTGFDADNKARKMGDINLYVPLKSYGDVESIHNMLLQMIVEEMEDN